jgi:hypothetical protein
MRDYWPARSDIISGYAVSAGHYDTQPFERVASDSGTIGVPGKGITPISQPGHGVLAPKVRCRIEFSHKICSE